MNKRIAITCVHGTYGRSRSQSAWYRKTSPIVREIASRATSKKFTIEHGYVEWSGCNSSLARRKGAQLVRKRLMRVANDGSFAYHIIIAHSHGGNVALTALDHSRLNGPETHLICLSTPFLNHEVRDFSFGLELITIAAGYVLLLAFCLVGIISAAHLISLLQPPDWITLLLFFGGAILPVLVLQKFNLSKNMSVLKGRKTREHLKVHVVRRNGDEASTLLGFGSLGALFSDVLIWLLTLAINLINSVQKRILPKLHSSSINRYFERLGARPRKIVHVGIAILSIGFLALFTFGMHWLQQTDFFPFGAMTALYFVISIGILMLANAAVQAIVFGPDYFLASLSLRTTVDSVPANYPAISHVVDQHSSLTDRPLLRHSSHSDAEVISVVSKILNSILVSEEDPERREKATTKRRSFRS